ncbi:MAG: 6-carboxytetrahydropterin synthase QueD [Ruminococcus sp.]|nr:6-carboxytetrahydropterin synthase QueD [Ruminococcus sp.]
MYSLKTSASFDSAHFLSGYSGKCSNIHGHRWVIEAVVSSDTLTENGEKRGMIIDFADFKKLLKNTADSFDHALIYEKGSLKDTTLDALKDENFRLIEVPFRPTAENFARHFFDILKSSGICPKSVTVFETPENCAVYEE